MVYARFNLVTADVYVGQTQSLLKRTHQHFAATYKHSERCAQPCRRCREHCKYLLRIGGTRE